MYNVNQKLEFLFLPSLILLLVILLFISWLHFYWALGGERGFYEALPTNEKGERFFTPKKIHSAIVGVLFKVIIGVVIFIVNGGGMKFSSPSVIPLLGIGVLFLLRAIGDFKYVGFLKKVKETDFGRRDTKWYSPLCFFIAILFLLVSISIPIYVYGYPIF